MLAADISAYELVPDDPNRPAQRDLIMSLNSLRYIASFSDGGVFKGTTSEQYAMDVLGNLLDEGVITEASKRSKIGKSKVARKDECHINAMKADVCDMISTSFAYINAQTNTLFQHEGETDADYEARANEHRIRTIQARSKERSLCDKASLYNLSLIHI